MTELSIDMIDKLKSLASRERADETEDGDFDEDFNPQDMYGGNFDDAYAGGVRDGNIEMAREILSHLNIEW